MSNSKGEENKMM